MSIFNPMSPLIFCDQISDATFRKKSYRRAGLFGNHGAIWESAIGKFLTAHHEEICVKEEETNIDIGRW